MLSWILRGASFAALAVAVSVWAWEDRAVLEFATPAGITAGQRLKVCGENQDKAEQVLVIRIDDSASPGYADRVNLERVLPPGPFCLEIGLGGLFTPLGRALDVARLRQVIVFQGQGSGAFLLQTPEILPAINLPAGAKGWDLGSRRSALFPGFEAMGPDFPGLKGVQPIALERGRGQQASDPLTSDGIKGIGSLQLPLPPGRWHLTLWLRDPGEWEFLPHPLERRIRANGEVVWQQRFSAQEWIERVYLAGRNREAGLADDAWTLYGERPEGRISFPVDVGSDGVLLEFDGEQPEAGFVAAILAEPEGDYRVRDQVEQQRAAWWRATWKVKPRAPIAIGEPALQPASHSAKAARGTLIQFPFLLQVGIGGQVPEIHIEAPRLGGVELPVERRWGQWRLARTGLNSTLLELRDDWLRGDAVPAIPAGLPRRLQLQVRIPEDAPAGLYQGRLQVRHEGKWLEAPLKLEVPDVDLPPVDRPVGVYLERPVHFGWFGETVRQADQALACDLRFLRHQGLTGIAPPFTTPSTDPEREALQREIAQVQQAGFLAPYLAYAPVKRLLSQIGLERTPALLGEAEQRLAQAGLPAPLWAIADEPSNLGQVAEPGVLSRHIRAFAPQAKLAGQLNNPVDLPGAESYDVALVNAGFGADRVDLERLAAKGASPWLYNMVSPRAAAGFYLWRSGARGYLQWHARMPTADPFDPTDGREDDVQFLLPAAAPCPAVPDMDANLLKISEGITDLRWLLWLEQQAKRDPSVQALLDRLQQEIPDRWNAMAAIPDEQMEEWRGRVMGLVVGR